MPDAIRKRIVVTGASGFVGRGLVPALADAGAELLLVGRNPDELRRRFPGKICCGYDEIPSHARGFDLLVHLAVVNNPADCAADAFRKVNVHLLLATAGRAAESSIGTFVNVSSIHALDSQNRTPYAASKREAVEALRSIKNIGVKTIYLPAIRANGWSGNLSPLNYLPPRLAHILFKVLGAFKPTIDLRTLVEYILSDDVAHPDSVILTKGQKNNPYYRYIKRLIDVTFASFILILFWWILLIIWFGVKCDSRGPGIFSQERVGEKGRIFTCYKFRTMKNTTVEIPTHHIPFSAVTRVGRLLRRTKLDELPQVWNILRNEMSLVGPRPSLPLQDELVAARRRRGVLELKPGITGLAQINGIDMSEPATLATWDARYRSLQSLKLDMQILVQTARGAGSGDRIRILPMTETSSTLANRNGTDKAPD